MNPLNHASLEASKRLVEAGIELYTDMVWFHGPRGTWHVSERYMCSRGSETIPAPLMTEVWRELPDSIPTCPGSVLCLEKILRDDKDEIIMSASYDYEDEHMGRCTYKYFAACNPVDALINMLIWVKKGKDNKV